MQLIEGGPSIPESLLQRHADGRVVFFCGAGISLPAGLPNFQKLVEKLYKENRVCPSPLQKKAISDGQYDLALDMLENQVIDGREGVRSKLAGLLEPDKGRASESVHQDLLTLSKNDAGIVRLVTTNYDRLFEETIEKSGQKIRTFSAPSLPIPKQSWEGIVYLHGLLQEVPDKINLDSLVLSSADFGLAYLTERWAARFASELFKNFTVCFVGYSINDPVLRYMMDALAADRTFGENLPEAYAFCGYSDANEQEDKENWEIKKVIPIFYNDKECHRYFHETLRCWAELHKDGSLGKERFVRDYAINSPKTSTSENDFASRVIWALSDENGGPAKVFSELKPVPSLDWLNPILRDRPLSERSTQVVTYLNSWLIYHLNNPKLLYSLANKQELFPRLQERIEHQVRKIDDFKNKAEVEKLDEIDTKGPDSIPSSFMRNLWGLFFAQKVITSHSPRSLFRWLDKFKVGKPNKALKRELEHLLTPHIFLPAPIQENSSSVEQKLWGSFSPCIALSSNHVFAILEKLKKNQKWQEALPDYFQVFNYLLVDALELMEAIELADESYDPSCLDLPCIGTEQFSALLSDWAALIILTRDAWLALVEVEQERAVLAAELWMIEPYPLFKRLAFFVATQKEVISPKRGLDWLLADNHKWLWSANTRKEAIKLLGHLAQHLAKPDIERLEQAVLVGPSEQINDAILSPYQISYEIFLRLTQLSRSAESIGEEAAKKLDLLSKQYPELKELERNVRQGQMVIRPLEPVPTPRTLKQLVEWLKESNQSGKPSYDDWSIRCRDEPEMTIKALCHLAQEDIWPLRSWQIALAAWAVSEEALLCSWSHLAITLTNAPKKEFGCLANEISLWLYGAAGVLNDNGGQFFSLIDRVLSQEQQTNMVKSCLFKQAINHPVGQVTRALVIWAGREKPTGSASMNDAVKERLTNIIQNGAAGFEFGRLCLAHKLKALYLLEPEWVEEYLLPLFNWERSDYNARMAWTGLLSKNNFRLSLLSLIKNEFLSTATRLDLLGEQQRRKYVSWLAFISIQNGFNFSQEALSEATRALPAKDLASVVRVMAKKIEDTPDKENCWHNYILPYIDNIFPTTIDKRSQKLSQQFGRLCIAADGIFPDVYNRVKGWLMPIGNFCCLMYDLKISELCEKYPNEALGFMNKVLDPSDSIHLDSAKSCLDKIGSISPPLRETPEYKKLENHLRIY